MTDVAPSDERVSVALREDGADAVFELTSAEVNDFARDLETVNVPPVYAARVLISLRQLSEARPFEYSPVGKATRPISVEEQCRTLQDRLHRMEGWWGEAG